MTYIGANLRPDDAREVLCQVPEGVSGAAAAAAILQSLPERWAWVAEIDGQPVCAFGFQPFTAPVWVGWAFGTWRMRRAIPAVTRFCLGQEQRLLDNGVRRVEVRTIKGHDVSHKWLAALGCKYQCDLPDHGRTGETFELWSWTLSGGLPSQTRTYRDVPTQDTFTPATAPGPTAS